MPTIIVQGAMPCEIAYLKEWLPGGHTVTHGGYSFYETSYQQAQIIISLTEIGIVNATLATMMAIEKYHPTYIINQGTAGGHLPDLRPGDIIIGSSAVYLNDMRMPLKKVGEGSNALEWSPGSGCFILEADPALVTLAESLASEGCLTVGRLGSGDLFSREADRIQWLHAKLGALCEDMESAAVYKACHACQIPVIGIRIISNNELTGNHDDPEQTDPIHKKLQKYILAYLKKLIERKK